MQQRVMIAMALMLEPKLIIADEPTTALDVTTQAQIFALIRKMKQNHTALLLITHDMGVVWEMCDRVMVMYASRIVESGGLEDIFNAPAHPYTRGLMAAIPRLAKGRNYLKAIEGQVPSPGHYPQGCRFQDRCPEVFERCRKEDPRLMQCGKDHMAACFLAYPDREA
jgi:peptide/nickel transport system ATP-binding protein/oligopeptide transport system ATP-binding protein